MIAHIRCQSCHGIIRAESDGDVAVRLALGLARECQGAGCHGPWSLVVWEHERDHAHVYVVEELGNGDQTLTAYRVEYRDS